MEQQQAVRLVDCPVVFDWLKPGAAAKMTITSPSGKSVVVQRSEFEKLPGELQIVVKHFVGLCLKSANNVLQLTIEEMRQLKAVDECINTLQPAKQVVEEKPRGADEAITALAKYKELQQKGCGCGGSYRIKPHQGWIGYYCPKCKKGGSISIKEHQQSKKQFKNRLKNTR
jgi:hypothetical protein